MLKIFERLSIAGKLMTVTGLLVGALLLSGFSLVILQANGVVSSLSIDVTKSHAASEANALKSELETLQGAVHATAGALGSLHEDGLRDRTTAMNMLKPNVHVSPIALGAWFFTEPNGWDGQDTQMSRHAASTATGRFMPYWVEQQGWVPMDAATEAAVGTAEYYRRARDSGKGVITEPFTYPVKGKTVTMTSIAYPVKSRGRVIGVAGIDIGLDEISARLGRLRPFGTGRVSLLSSSARWVAHHDPKRRMQTYSDPGLEEVRHAIRSGETRFIHGLEVEGVPVQRLVRPFRLAGLASTWALVIDVPKATISAPADRLAWQLILGGIIIVVALLSGLFLAARSIIGRPMGELSLAVDRLAKGDEVEVPQLGRQDEIGTLARASEIFRKAALSRAAADVRAAEEQKKLESMQMAEKAKREVEQRHQEELRLRNIREQEDRERVRAEAEAGRRTELYALANSLEQRILSTASFLNDASESMEHTAKGLAATASSTKAGVVTATLATEQTGLNVQCFATASEQLLGAISEISERTQVTVRAARSMRERASMAAADVRTLEAGTVQIGEVTSLIASLAHQTNMLSLNAAIEAARAGNAGRGFGIVAAEVKNLADETTRATQLIEQQVQTLRRATSAVSGSIGAVQDIVGEVDAATLSISTAVHQQRDATIEIERRARETAVGAESLHNMMGSVKAQADAADSAADQLFRATNALEGRTTELREEVVAVISQIRAAA